MNYKFKLGALFVVTLVFDYVLRYFTHVPNLVLADPVTLGVIGAVTAIAGATTGALSFVETRKARRAQGRLEEERRQQLTREGAARSAAARRAATTGQRFGIRTDFLSGTGFGNQDQTGLGVGALFGN